MSGFVLQSSLCHDSPSRLHCVLIWLSVFIVSRFVLQCSLCHDSSSSLHCVVICLAVFIVWDSSYGVYCVMIRLAVFNVSRLFRSLHCVTKCLTVLILLHRVIHYCMFFITCGRWNLPVINNLLILTVLPTFYVCMRNWGYSVMSCLLRIPYTITCPWL